MNKCIQSMTGFGRAQLETDQLSAVCEIRALNGRYFEADLRLPKFLYEIDAPIRRALNEKLERGTITCIFNISFPNFRPQDQQISINTGLAEAYLERYKALSLALDLDFRDPFREIIRIPDVIQSGERAIDASVKEAIIALSLKAADHLIQFREEEGRATGRKLLLLVDAIQGDLDIVSSHEEDRRLGLRTRIYAQLAEHVLAELRDTNRFEQEILLYLDKWDIAEEKQRLQQHVGYFKQCLEKEPFGRKLNFIAQEMGREMNTMGVKSNYFPMQQAVVEMKEKLEQIKEQVLNLV
ncbi:MAG: YicC family protein [Flavobacteriales bacterium]|nr:MAG: YicC family protein [Flavobacteriales bacterium]